MSELIFTKKPSDGWVAKKINARISIPISKRLVRIHPNWITLMNLPFVLLTTYFITQPSYIAGALAGIGFQWCSIFDGCDGEVARACNKESLLGGWLDTAMDNLCYILLILGLGIWGFILPALAAALMMTIAFILTYIAMWKMGTSSHKIYREAFRKTSNRRIHLDELGRRENFSVIVMFLLLLNLRTLLYWIVIPFAFLYACGIIFTFRTVYKQIKTAEVS